MKIATPEWQDVSHYSRGDRGKAEPNSFVVKIGPLRLVVTRHKDYEPDDWVTYCEPFVFKQTLKNKQIAHAKREALHLLNTAIDDCRLQALKATTATC